LKKERFFCSKQVAGDGLMEAWRCAMRIDSHSVGSLCFRAIRIVRLTLSFLVGTSLSIHGAGQIMAWGDNSDGQTNVPPALTTVVAIAAGWHHCLALKPDGNVVGWGYNGNGETTVPGDLVDAVAIERCSASQRDRLSLGQQLICATWIDRCCHHIKDGQSLSGTKTGRNSRCMGIQPIRPD
jgi:hypothetical protein